MKTGLIYLITNTAKMREAASKRWLHMNDVAGTPEGQCACGCGGATPLAKWSDKTKGYVKGKPKRFIKGHHSHVSRKVAA